MKNGTWLVKDGKRVAAVKDGGKVVPVKSPESKIKTTAKADDGGN